jgi:transposase
MTRPEIQAVYEAGPEAVFTLVESLLATIAQQQAALDQLTARVQHLENQLAQKSHNSHKPPSSDGPGKKTQSQRGKSENPPGGQRGHPGRTLRMTEHPDHTVRHFPERCSCCDQDLTALPATDVEARQVFDVVLTPLQVTEHQVGTKRCPRCGSAERGQFPAWVTQPVQYGPHLLSLLVYLVVFQLLPWKRTRELIADLFGVWIGGGTLQAAVERCFTGLAATGEQIQEAIRRAQTIGVDETGVRIDGTLHWWHTASTAQYTHYHVHRKRGRAGIDAGGILPAFAGRATHDAWAPYGAYPCDHSLCNAHHLRELTYLWEREQQEWAEELHELLVLAYVQVEGARAAGKCALDAVTRATIRAEYRRILAAGWAANPAEVEPAAGAKAGGQRGRRAQSKARNLLGRLTRFEEETLAFVDNFAVPFDNNQAERDLRMLKVQQKISGGFRSVEGAERFARIRGYLVTMRKQGQAMLGAIASVFEGHPAVPSLSA